MGRRVDIDFQFDLHLKSLDWNDKDPIQKAMYLRLKDACRNIVKETKEMYSECFEQFIPVDKWDEATKFLSTYKDGLAEDFEKKERL